MTLIVVIPFLVASSRGNIFDKVIRTLVVMTEFELKFEVSCTCLKRFVLAVICDKARHQLLPSGYFDARGVLTATDEMAVRLHELKTCGVQYL